MTVLRMQRRTLIKTFSGMAAQRRRAKQSEERIKFGRTQDLNAQLLQEAGIRGPQVLSETEKPRFNPVCGWVRLPEIPRQASVHLSNAEKRVSDQPVQTSRNAR